MIIKIRILYRFFNELYRKFIPTRIENAFLSAYYESLGDKLWIGLQKITADDGTNTFRWVDGTDLNFDNWGSSEPSKKFDKLRVIKSFFGMNVKKN